MAALALAFVVDQIASWHLSEKVSQLPSGRPPGGWADIVKEELLRVLRRGPVCCIGLISSTCWIFLKPL